MPPGAASPAPVACSSGFLAVAGLVGLPEGRHLCLDWRPPSWWALDRRLLQPTSQFSTECLTGGWTPTQMCRCLCVRHSARATYCPIAGHETPPCPAQPLLPLPRGPGPLEGRPFLVG